MNSHAEATAAKRRVALFGGSFNPPHIGHVLAALYVLETSPVDELWVLPTFRHPFEKELAPFDQRVAMCELAFGRMADLTVLDVEAHLQLPSRTLHTVEHLASHHPDVTFSLVVGTDVWAERNLWYGFDRLEKMVSFIVLGRRGYLGPTDGPAMLPDVSSSRVRAALAAGRRTAELAAAVPRDVLRYIEEKGLYP